ncbi:MAG: HAD family hydrolase [candidate division KSB1 bacterium]|nr:HAD family hydrolase [candidate division KSB1 bacterium]
MENLLKYSAILFDLDDTLLRNNADRFVKHYFKTLTPCVSGYFEETEFISLMTGATQAVLSAKRGRRTLRQVFADYFERQSSVSFSTLEGIVKEYYHNDYLKIRQITHPVAGASAAVQAAAQLTSNLVLATVPIFPYAAIKERVRWAGLDSAMFSMITSYEIMHVSKPHPDYYLEICEKLDCRPSRCLMIGNDYQDDMSARVAGLETFLVNNYALGDAENGFAPHYSGSMAELLVFLRDSARVDQ